jgi:hypothetical protein
MHIEMGEISNGNADISEACHQLRHLLMRQLQEAIQNVELEQILHGRGVYRVAAKVAQEISVLLKYSHRIAGSGEQETKHHAGGAAADDATVERSRYGHLRDDHGSPRTSGNQGHTAIRTLSLDDMCPRKSAILHRVTGIHNERRGISKKLEIYSVVIGTDQYRMMIADRLPGEIDGKSPGKR